MWDCANVHISDDGAHDTCFQICLPRGGVATCSTACFPATATVETQSGKRVQMSDLHIGDVVRAGAADYSPIHGFSHSEPETIEFFVQMMTSFGALTCTPDHYIYADSRLIPAMQATVGMSLTSANGTQHVITQISTIKAKGIYNPHTLTGDIVVDGYMTSTYTIAVPPSLAHALLWPARVLYSMTGLNALAPLHSHGLPLTISHFLPTLTTAE